MPHREEKCAHIFAYTIYPCVQSCLVRPSPTCLMSLRSSSVCLGLSASVRGCLGGRGLRPGRLTCRLGETCLVVNCDDKPTTQEVGLWHNCDLAVSSKARPLVTYGSVGGCLAGRGSHGGPAPAPPPLCHRRGGGGQGGGRRKRVPSPGKYIIIIYIFFCERQYNRQAGRQTDRQTVRWICWLKCEARFCAWIFPPTHPCAEVGGGPWGPHLGSGGRW